jgi:transcription initiation factor TFIIF subunit alpha
LGTSKSKKRPGSPNLSEASGNESSRKKPKKNKKNRVVLGSTPGASPGTSRAGSPSAPSHSRAASPAASTPKLGMPSAREIYDCLPPSGMHIAVLITKFKGRVDRTNTQHFIKLVKAVAHYDKVKNELTPLAQMPSDETVERHMNPAK